MCFIEINIGHTLEYVLATEDNRFADIKLHATCPCVKMNFADSKAKPLWAVHSNNLQVVVRFFTLLESAFILHFAEGLG